ncbi:cytochrome P450 4c3-like [Parasteatoda tepidariorum]|uniref:cytochrome P450 4c3-like n=1 Tax=Parasteatoda tepidariorum TaxID=114398 RepID=UPI001C71E693|nr:cytochrome P450 4c3-like [Parasteatoda tepidariorum]
MFSFFGAASDVFIAKTTNWKPEHNWKLWILTLILSLVVIPFIRTVLEQRKKTNLLWKLPGCNVNHLFLYLAIAKTVVLNNQIKSNILTFQVLCGTTILFYKEKLWRMWIGIKPVVVFFKPETVELILNSNTVLKKTFMYAFLNNWFKEGLITSSGSKWRARRKLLTPAFHFRILSDFQPVIDEQSRILTQVLDEKVGEIFDVVQPITLCTLDILCETAMGIKIEAQRKDSKYLEALKVASEQFSDRIMKPWVWTDFLYYLTPEGRNYKKNVAAMLQFTSTVIRDRKKEMLSKSYVDVSNDEDLGENKKRKAFLDLLLDVHIKENMLSERDIREEVDTFMFAGHDTTAMGISWALYNIGLRQDIQDTIHEELDRIFGDDKNRPITTKDVREMKYLECVLKESQRLYPSLPVIGRELEEDISIDGHTIPAGTTCLLATFMLHRNPEIYPNPEVFDPDRFLPDNCAGRHPFAYVPFSAGPRNCIGQRFAMLEEKTVVANILRKFRIESLDSRDKLHLTAELVLRNDGPLRIKVHRR